MDKIKKITINDLKYIKELADHAFGSNYLNLNYFNKVLNSSLYYSWIIHNKANIPIAFLVAYKTSKQEIASYLDDKSIKLQVNDNTICLDTMVVNPRFRKQGIGKKLIENAMNQLFESSYIMYAWKNGKTINMEGIANEFNFKIIKEYKQLWKKDCLDNKFQCPSKKINTCNCTTIVYYKSLSIR